MDSTAIDLEVEADDAAAAPAIVPTLTPSIPLDAPHLRMRAGAPTRFRWETFAIASPMLLACLIALGISFYSIYTRLLLPYPQNPWESSILVEAARVVAGAPVYEMPPEGHAAHLYGPLINYLIGAVFWFTGPNLYAGRAIALISAVLLCAVFIAMFVRRRDWFAALVAMALVFGLHYRCRAYFTETRPDAIALLLATLSLLAAYRAASNRSLLMWILSGMLVVAAFGFKQTYAAAAVVPPLAVFMSRRQRTRADLLVAFIPLACIATSLLTMRVLAPTVFFYTVKVPAIYRVPPDRLIWAVGSLFLLSPLFLVMFFVPGLRRGFDYTRRWKMTWVLVATLIGGAAGAVACAKRGGTYNSLLLGFAPMAAFCVVAMPRVFRWLTDGRNALVARLTVSMILAICLLATTLGVPSSGRWAYQAGHGTEEHERVVRIAAKLKGKVICPDDPTIMLLARGQLDLSLDAELDAAGRPEELPPDLAKQFRSANWLIRVHTVFENFRNEELLKQLGFKRVQTPRLGRGYSLWRRIVGEDAPLPPNLTLSTRRPASREKP